MTKYFFLLLFFGGGILAYGQFPPDTLRLYDPLAETSGYTSGFADEEDYSGYFLPAQTGNGNYLPMGQLSRHLIGVRFRPRGYDSRYLDYEVNGSELSDPTDGFPYWNIIASLNLLSPVHNDVNGLSLSGFLPGGVGGVASISTTDRHAAGPRRVSYAHTNRTYRHRLVFQDRTVAPGGLTLLYGLNLRTGKDGFVKGAYTDRLDSAVGLHKRFGKSRKHLLLFLLASTGSVQGVRSAATQEVYDLAGNNYYNPNWGYLNSRMRNSRERSYEQYFTAIHFESKPNNQWTLRASSSLFGGENSYSLPAWYEAPTPYPDYYRYLPDFYANPETSAALRKAWTDGDPAVTQVDWSKLYEANAYNADPNGIARSHYIVRDLVTDKRNLAFSLSAEYRPDFRLTLRGGLGVRSDYSDNYARLDDLLGGAYWLDIDQYLLDDEYYGGMYQNDVRNPDRPVFSGGRFGYNYRMRSTSLRGWGVVDYRTAAWSAFASLEAGNASFRREGQYEKELFPGNLSYGKSERIDFQEYTIKAGVFYHFSLRHRIGIQAAMADRAPLVKNLFVAPSYRNETLPGSETVKIRGAEVLYQWVSPLFSWHLTGYVTAFSGESEVRNFYDDIEGEYMNLALSGIDKIHGGVELGAEWNAMPRLSLLGAAAVGVYRYDNDPSVALYRDSDGRVMLSGATAYLSGYRLSGTPQAAGMLQLNYRTRSYWRFELSGKYTAHNYVSMNPVRRMERALALAGSPEIQREMAGQERLDDAFLLSLSVGKTFRMRNGDRIGLWANIDNLLNDRTVRYSGYEQWRFSRTDAGAGRTLRPFPSKYYYAYGANYYAMLSYTF